MASPHQASGSPQQRAPGARPQTAPQYPRVGSSTRRRFKLAEQARQAATAFERPPAVSAQEEDASELLLSLSDDENASAKISAGDISAIQKEGDQKYTGLSMLQVGMLKRRVRGFSAPKQHFPSDLSEADQQVAAELRWSDSAMTLPEFHRIEVQLRKQAVDLAEENQRLRGQVDVMNATIMRHQNAPQGRLTQQARARSPEKGAHHCWQGLQMHSSLGCKQCLCEHSKPLPCTCWQMRRDKLTSYICEGTSSDRFCFAWCAGARCRRQRGARSGRWAGTISTTTWCRGTRDLHVDSP